MGRVRAAAEQTIAAKPDTVFSLLSDYEQGRRKILTDNYRDYKVEEGGRGDGTIVSYRFEAGGRERSYRLQVREQAGRELRESDTESSFVTVWQVSPADGGTKVTVASEWEGAGGIGGLFERLFAPVGLKRIYSEVLNRLGEATSSR
jgi:Polyketide cyclase / dehydrase and lipid transport